MTTLPDFTHLHTWVGEAGALALKFYQTQITRTRKKDNSPVTAADVAVEKFLVGKLEQAFNPEQYGILGEEGGGQGNNREFMWVIDPIDGTRVFADGLPLWCISLGLLHQGQPVWGLVYLPVLNEIFYTDAAGQAFWNGRPLAGLLRTHWDQDSFIGVPSAVHRYFEIDFHRLRALGSVAAHHLYVANGTAVAALHRKVKVWDLAGAHAILTAVGGQAVYLSGQPISLARMLTNSTAAEPILAGHPAVLEKLLPKIKYLEPVAVP